MSRAIARFWLTAATLLLGGNSLFAYALLGPVNEAYQVQTIGFNEVNPNWGADVGAPKNIGQFYRYNTKVIYYAPAPSFTEYFGTNGISEADKAFLVYNSLRNVDAYSRSLSEIPDNTTRVNYSAAQVGLTDLKSLVMSLIAEQLGLAEPDRYTFTLHSRFLPTGGMCPNYDYFVIMRNFDPVTDNYSPYVNGVLYTFGIVEECAAMNNPYAPADAFTQVTPVDPTQLANAGSSVVTADGPANGIVYESGFTVGSYYNGLTRDDVGGLRYLWSSNTVATEAVSPDSVEVVSNTPTALVTSNYVDLLSASTNETEAELLSNYPPLNITGSNFLYNATLYTTNKTTNTIVVTNPAPPQSPAGTPPTIVTNTVIVYSTNSSLQSVYSYTYGNVINPLIFYSNGVLVTNFDFFIFTPTNACGFTILSNLGTATVTNTNTGALSTNITLAVEIPNCVAGVSNQLEEGMEGITFVRVDYDDLIGQTWGPVSNSYTLTAINTKGVPVSQIFQRTVTAPDITLETTDLLGGPAADTDSEISRTGPTFNAGSALPGEAGPGTITPGGTSFTFNNVGPVFENQQSDFIGSDTFGSAWGSFDGTTNTPIVYPTSQTLQSLLSSIFLQITLTGPLPAATVGQAYQFQMPVTGAYPPFTWTVAPVAGGLPPGLTLSPFSGVISGTPSTSGIYDVAIDVADSNNDISQRFITITVNPAP